MDDDKIAAYTTLREVISTYVKIAAPFAPFITEQIWQEMQKFSTHAHSESIHLGYRPLATDKYINHELITETETIRKIIK